MATWDLISHLVDDSGNELCSQVTSDDELGPKIVKVEGNCATTFSTDDEDSGSPGERLPRGEEGASPLTERTDASPLPRDAVEDCKIGISRSEKTIQNNRWAVNVWQAWATYRNSLAKTSLEEVPVVPVDLKSAQQDQVTFWLPRFIQEVKAADGGEYNGGTLKQLMGLLHRYMKTECKYTGPSFNKLHSRLLLEVGVTHPQDGGGEKYKWDKLSKRIKRSILWDMNILNLVTSEGILNAVLVYNKEVLGLRNQREHRHLKIEHLRLRENKRGTKYVAFWKPMMKATLPGTVQQSRRKPIRHYDRKEDNNGESSRSYYEVLQTYFKYLPERKGPFYRRPAAVSSVTTPSQPKFTKTPIGELALAEMLKAIYREAVERIETKNNHTTKSSTDTSPITKQEIGLKPQIRLRYEEPVIIPIVDLGDEEPASAPPSSSDSDTGEHQPRAATIAPSTNTSSTLTATTTDRSSGASNAAPSAGATGLCYNLAVENRKISLELSADTQVTYTVSSYDGGKRFKFCFQTA